MKVTKAQAKTLLHEQVMRGYRILMGEEEAPVSTPPLACEKCGTTFTLIETFNRHYPRCRRAK